MWERICSASFSPGRVRALKANLKNMDAGKVAVVVATSGESCPACHDKIEILARILIDEQLLVEGHFIVAYGATYADTLHVAGFNDEPYHADMTKPESARLIRIESAQIDDVPDAVKQVLAGAPVALVTGDLVIAGQDERSKHFTFVPEVHRDACRLPAAQTKRCG